MTAQKPDSQWISDKTKIKVSIAGVAAICVTIIGATWAARGYLDDWKKEISTQFDEIKSAQAAAENDLKETRTGMAYKVSSGQFEQWTNQLDKQNRSVQRSGGELGLIVPDLPAAVARPVN